MPKFTVKSPLEHDGKPYRVGSTVEMSDGQAELLVTLGRVEPVKAPALVKGEEKPKG